LLGFSLPLEGLALALKLKQQGRGLITCGVGLSGLVSRQHPQLASLLSCIQFASVAVVNIQYQQNVLPVQVSYTHSIAFLKLINYSIILKIEINVLNKQYD